MYRIFFFSVDIFHPRHRRRRSRLGRSPRGTATLSSRRRPPRPMPSRKAKRPRRSPLWHHNNARPTFSRFSRGRSHCWSSRTHARTSPRHGSISPSSLTLSLSRSIALALRRRPRPGTADSQRMFAQVATAAAAAAAATAPVASAATAVPVTLSAARSQPVATTSAKLLFLLYYYYYLLLSDRFYFFLYIFFLINAPEKRVHFVAHAYFVFCFIFIHEILWFSSLEKRWPREGYTFFESQK